MLAFLATALFLQKIAAPEIHVDFYTISSATFAVELAVEARAWPKGAAPGDAPKKILRYFTWNTGATTSNDNSELARLVAQAMTEAGLEASSDGSETIIKNAAGVTVKSNHWLSLGAQVWAAAPKDAKNCNFTINFEPDGLVGKAALVLGGAAKAGRPRVPEGDDLGETAPDPKAKPGEKPGDKPKSPPKPAPAPAKPADPKAKKPSTELKIIIPAASNGAGVKEIVMKETAAAGWKLEAEGNSKFKITAAADGAPRWAFARFCGEGKGTIGIEVAVTAPESKEPAKK